MLIHFYILYVITNHVSAKRTSYSYDNSILLNCFIVLKLAEFYLANVNYFAKRNKGFIRSLSSYLQDSPFVGHSMIIYDV